MPDAQISGNSGNIVDRLRQALGLRRDAELVEALDSKPQTVSSWRGRDRVPLEICVEVARRSGRSLDWIILGADRAERIEEPRIADYADARGPPPDPTPTDADPDRRLAALQDWLDAWWRAATEEERRWLIVELRDLRARLRHARSP